MGRERAGAEYPSSPKELFKDKNPLSKNTKTTFNCFLGNTLPFHIPMGRGKNVPPFFLWDVSNKLSLDGVPPSDTLRILQIRVCPTLTPPMEEWGKKIN